MDALLYAITVIGVWLIVCCLIVQYGIERNNEERRWYRNRTRREMNEEAIQTEMATRHLLRHTELYPQ